MKVTFNINFHTVWGQKLCVVGSIPELGSWEPALASDLSCQGYRIQIFPECKRQADIRGMGKEPSGILYRPGRPIYTI